MRSALLLVAMVSVPALADTAKPPQQKVYEPKPPPPPHKEGEYGGVTPGTKPADNAKPHGKKPAKGTLSWIGFEAKDGGAQVFFQSVAPFEVTQQIVGGSVYAYLTLPRLGTNTWRQVDTRYFDNPLSGIVARTVGAAKATKDRAAHPAGIEVRIAFKNPKDAKDGAVRSETGPDGMYYVYVSFPEGTVDPSTKGGNATLKDPEK